MQPDPRYDSDESNARRSALPSPILAAIARAAPGLVSEELRDEAQRVQVGWVRWLPLAGACAGGVAALVQASLRWIGVVPAVAALGALIALAWATRALGERGVAQFVAGASDGIVGPAAAMAVIATRFILVLAIAPSAWLGALLASLVWSRAAAVLVARLGDVAPEESPGQGVAIGEVTSGDLGLALALALPLSAVAKGVGLGAGVVAIVAATIAGVLVHRRQAGLDTAGTAVVLISAELAALAWFAVCLPAAVTPWTI